MQIEPDKGAIAAAALVQLSQVVPAAKGQRYLSVAVKTAQALAATQGPGTNVSAPWPFRVDAETGLGVDGLKNGNMAYALRLYRDLVRLGYKEFSEPAARLWEWISTVQLESVAVCKVVVYTRIRLTNRTPACAIL